MSEVGAVTGCVQVLDVTGDAVGLLAQAAQFVAAQPRQRQLGEADQGVALRRQVTAQ